MSAIGNELVLYGGDKSGLLVCNTADTDWKWVAPSVQGRCVHTFLTRSTCHLLDAATEGMAVVAVEHQAVPHLSWLC